MAGLLPSEVLAKAAAKLRANVVRSDGGCLLWTGYTQPNGYGWVNVAGLKIAAHRLAMILAGIALPPDMDACHRCDVRNCVEPAHLYVGTRRQNMADCTARGRHNKPVGAAHWRAKLSDTEVTELRRRRALGETTTSIAEAFGINTGTVSRIARGLWRGEVA